MSEIVELIHGQAKDTKCVIRKFGATITSWTVDGVENIFVSSKAILDGSKAIRGGIPVCFPSFGPWEFGPQHGFARSSDKWIVAQEPTVDSNRGDVKTILKLESDDHSRSVWTGRDFELAYSITLGHRTLKLEVEVVNKGKIDLGFTFALHTYYKTPDVTQCLISNLKGLSYVDKVKGGEIVPKETNDPVQVNSFTDRIYIDAPDEVKLKGLIGGRALKLSKHNMSDFVIWNPWQENAKKMADFGDDEYKGMICVEAVQTSKEITLKENEKWNASHTLAVHD